MTTRIARYLFNNEGALTVTTRTIEDQHWYTAVDICNLLGIENHSQAVHRERTTDNFGLDDTEWRKETIFNGGSRRKMLLVNDNGMLKLILQGTSDRAQEVQERARQAPVTKVDRLIDALAVLTEMHIISEPVSKSSGRRPEILHFVNPKVWEVIAS
jgi:hypothetical protein